MGQYDFNNYIIKVKLRDNVSDERFNAIRTIKPTINEYKKFLKKLVSDHPVYSEKAEELIKFFIEYGNGIIKPERYNCFEPINKVLNVENLEKPISMLAFPGGSVYLKKTKVVEIYINNETHSFVWADNKYITPKRDLPEYLTVITVFFPKKGKNLEFIVQLMQEIKDTFGADNGKVLNQATGEVLAE